MRDAPFVRTASMPLGPLGPVGRVGPLAPPAPAAPAASTPNTSLTAACCWALVAVLLLPAGLLYSAGSGAAAHAGVPPTATAALTPAPSPALVLQCVVVAHTGGALAWVLAGARVRLMAFGFWLFGYIWLGLAPLAMLAAGRYPLGYVVDQGTAAMACAVVETGLLAYTAGALAARARGQARGGRRSAVIGPLLMRRVAPVRVLLLGVAALLLAVLLVPQHGGLAAYFTSRQALNAPAAGTSQGATAGDSAGRALAAWALSAPAFWALLALLHIPRATKGRGDGVLRGLRWALLPPLVALNAVVNNPVSQPRFWAGTVLLAFLFGLPSLRRARGFRIAAGAVLVTVLVVFPYADHFRNSTREPLQLASPAQQFTENGDYDAYQQLQTALALRQRAGYAPQSALGPPLFFVPRAVWQGKPEDTGIRLARFAGYRFDNLSAPLWAESYLWAGLPAVVVVFGLYGALGRRVDDVREGLSHRSPRNGAGPGGTLAVLLVPGLAFFQLILLRGSLMANMGPLALLVLIPLCVSSRSGYRVQRNTEGSRTPAAQVPGRR